MSSHGSVLRVGFFLDGYTLKKVNEYYSKHHRYHARLDFRALKDWVRDYTTKLFGKDGCIVEIEAHYYHPYVRFEDTDLSVIDTGMGRFEKQLMLAGIEMHYNLPEEMGKMGPNMQLVEDAYLCAFYHKIDVLVLLSTQGQYSSLPERIRKERIPVLLLGWNFMYEKENSTVYWRTDASLREMCGYYVAMEKVAEMYPPDRHSTKNLFLLPYSSRTSQGQDVWNAYLQKLIASLDEPKPGFEKTGYKKSPAMARLG